MKRQPVSLALLFAVLMVIYLMRYVGALLLYFFPLSDKEMMKIWMDALASSGAEWWLLLGLLVKAAIDRLPGKPEEPSS